MNLCAVWRGTGTSARHLVQTKDMVATSVTGKSMAELKSKDAADSPSEWSSDLVHLRHVKINMDSDGRDMFLQLV